MEGDSEKRYQSLEDQNKLLLESEEKYKVFINLSSEGIWRCEAEVSIDIAFPVDEQVEMIFEKAVMVECNDTMAAMYGMKKEDLLGIKVKDLLIKSKQENVEYLKAFVKSGYKLFDAESIEVDSKGNTKYFLNNLVGIVKEGKLIGGWGTQRDITTIKKAEEALMKMNHDLNQKNEDLLRVNNELDNFIYTVTHDLNSPLSNIEGLINVLKLNPCSEEAEAKMLIDLMDVAIGKFKETIKNIAQITKTHGKQNQEDRVTDFKEILENVKFSIGNLISETDTTIESDFLAVESVAINRVNIQSIFYNLISNAIKYRHPDRSPQIYLKTLLDNGQLMIEVKDNGIGFSQEKEETIFDLFTRLHNHVEGSGIGLYIVKRIAENAGGRVIVESAPGAGSVFRVYMKIV